ncbi:MAG TPA: tetratricopeptide repeat protein [Gemmatimonadaceae bacterium]
MRVQLLSAIALAVVLATPARAQSAASHIAAGDEAYVLRDAAGALAHYELAAAADSLSHEAWWKASRSAADLEPRARGTARHAALLQKAESYARRAVALRSDGAEGHFALARALGVAARSRGARDRVRYASDVRNHALACLRYDPAHSGCLHIMGAWNAEVMRLTGLERFVARRLLGGRAFGSASWAEAIRYMEAAVAAAPDRIVHRTELAEIYADRGRFADARREYETALRIEPGDYNDSLYKAGARNALDRMGAPPRRE